MDEAATGTFANRDEPLPPIPLSGPEDSTLGLSSDDELDRNHLRADTDGNSVRDDSSTGEAPKGHKRNSSLQDRLFAKFVRHLRHESSRAEKSETCLSKMAY